MNIRVSNHLLSAHNPLLFSCLVIDERIKNFDLCSSSMMRDYVCIVNFLFVTGLLEPVGLFVLDNSDDISHFATVANIYQTFEGFSWTQTEILLPKSNPSVTGDALVVEIFFFNFPGYTWFHGRENVLQTPLIKFILLFVLELVEYRSQIVDSILRDLNIFARFKDFIRYLLILKTLILDLELVIILEKS